MTKIITNNHERSFLYRSEVPTDILESQFDYLDADTFVGFIHYRGHWYHTSCFMRFGYPGSVPFQGWHGYSSDSFYSGVLIKISDDGETYQIATYIS